MAKRGPSPAFEGGRRHRFWQQGSLTASQRKPLTQSIRIVHPSVGSGTRLALGPWRRKNSVRYEGSPALACAGVCYKLPFVTALPAAGRRQVSAASFGRLMACRRASTRAMPIWMRLPSSESRPALRRAVLSARSASRQSSTEVLFSGFVQSVMGKIERNARCFSPRSAQIRRHSDHLFVTIAVAFTLLVTGL